MSDAGFVADRWTAPLVQGPLAKARKPVSPDELTRQERATVDEYYARAKAEGLAAGRAEYEARNDELSARIARLDAVLNVLGKPLAELDADIEKQLVTLSLTVAKHLVRRELRIDPSQVVAIIRETVGLLPASARDVRVHLHPDDAALLRERLSAPQSDRAWTIIEDPVLSRGGCRVTTDTALIDARLETRLGAAIAQVLGSERSDGRAADDAGAGS